MVFIMMLLLVMFDFVMLDSAMLPVNKPAFMKFSLFAEEMPIAVAPDPKRAVIVAAQIERVVHNGAAWIHLNRRFRRMDVDIAAGQSGQSTSPQTQQRNRSQIHDVLRLEYLFRAALRLMPPHQEQHCSKCNTKVDIALPCRVELSDPLSALRFAGLRELINYARRWNYGVAPLCSREGS